MFTFECVTILYVPITIFTLALQKFAQRLIATSVLALREDLHLFPEQFVYCQLIPKTQFLLSRVPNLYLKFAATFVVHTSECCF